MSRYKVFTTPQAFKEIKALPGNIRQRVRRAIDVLLRNWLMIRDPNQARL
ncbi:MAG TPA: hypothetical protein VK747_04855 [Blastocatellia bacterium]|nr:hypothetical protein [Blastocatellia bacterium]